MLQTNVRGPLVIAGIVVGLSLVLGLGGSYLLSDYLAGETKAVVDARIASARAATLAPRITALKAQEELAASYDRVISLLLPTQEQLLEVPRDIEGLGRARNVEVQFQFLGSPGAGAAVPGSSLPFSLIATGDASAITEFLHDVEISNPRYTVSISGVELTVAQGSARANVAGSVYYQ